MRASFLILPLLGPIGALASAPPVGAQASGAQSGTDGGAEGTRVVRRSEPPITTLTDDPVVVDMEHSTGHPSVEVWVHGEGPFRFVVDTCAGGHGRVDDRLVELLGLETVGTVMMGDGTGENQREGQLVRVEALQVGDASFEGLTMLARAEADNGGRIADGILGFGLFEELLVTLDYKESKLRMRHGKLDAEAEHVVPFQAPDGVPSIDIRIGDTEMRAHVDSGNMGSLTLPGHYKESLELAAEPEPAGRAQTLFNDFEMWRAPLAQPLVLAGHERSGTEASFVDIFRTPNLGYAVLSSYAMTFDQKNGLVAFE